jgi:hypothetical protein
VLVPQDLELHVLRREKDTLNGAATRPPLRQGASMPIPANGHFLNQRIMPVKQCLQLTPPAQGFRMTRITFLPVHQYRPDRVQLPMLPEQMITTEPLGGDVPDAHYFSPQILFMNGIDRVARTISCDGIVQWSYFVRITKIIFYQ